MAIAPPTERMRELTATDTQLRRASETPGAHIGIRQRQWGIAARVDHSVTFEEYKFWAKIERQMEEEEYQRRLEHTHDQGFIGGIKDYFTKNPNDGKPITHPHFNNTYFMDFYRDYSKACRAVHKDCIMLMQFPTLELPPEVKGTPDDDPKMAFTPHYYDGITLMTKHW